MKEYFNTKVKPLFIKLRDHIYDDYGITPKFRTKFKKVLYNILKYILFIVGFIGVVLTTGILCYSMFVLIVFNPYVAILFFLVCTLVVLYILCRDYIDEKYRII